MLRLLRTKTATWMPWFVTIKSHCLLFIAPFGVNQVEDMIRVCKSRLLSLSCWMFKLLQISSNLITSHSLDAFLQSKARMAAFIVSIASSKSPAAYWAWPRAKSDLASGVACENHTMTDTWQVSRRLHSNDHWPGKSLVLFEQQSFDLLLFSWQALGTLPQSKVRWIQHWKGKWRNHTKPKSTNTGHWHFSKVSTRSPCA